MQKTGHGSTSLYGSGPCLDLNNKTSSGDDDDNILLLGSIDARHILKTSAQQWRHHNKTTDHQDKGRLNFHVIEAQAPLIARQLLFLSILFDKENESSTVKDSDSNNNSITSMGKQERIETFLEIYGNTLVREKTHLFIQQHATDLIKLVTDEKGPLQPYIDLSQLRFRERDDLEFVFKFWRNIGNKKKFDAKLLWEERCRSYYGARYDAREGVADWDLNMKLAEKASIIYKREFFKWRTHGIAYEVRESAYDYANRTMASVDGLKENGVMVVKWGIFSDIVSGPFYAYGIESENKELLKKSNEKHTQTSQDVAEYNMRAMLHELYYQSKYVEEKHATDAGVQVEEQKGESEGEEKPKITEITNEDETSATIAITAADCSDNASVSDRLSNLSINDASSGSTSSLAKLPSSENLKITFLPCDTSITLSKKRYKYIGKFNTIFLSNTMAQHLEECVGLLKNNNSDAVIIVETVKFMLDFDEDQSKAFNNKVMETASAAGLKLNHMDRYNENNADPTYLVFTL